MVTVDLDTLGLGFFITTPVDPVKIDGCQPVQLQRGMSVVDLATLSRLMPPGQAPLYMYENLR